MLHRFIIATLIIAAAGAMSFSTLPTSAPLSFAPKTGNSLTVTNPSPGTVAMSWIFAQPSLSYDYIIEDVVHRRVVRSGQTTLTSCTVSGLAPGTYRVKVINNSNFIIIIEDIIV